MYVFRLTRVFSANAILTLASDELKEAFSDAKRGEKRLLKVEIADGKKKNEL